MKLINLLLALIGATVEYLACCVVLWSVKAYKFITEW